jgi:type II secretory pathway pseudopilin PulG
MIELIFVIVIMGILAMVALPRFAGVQDDAMIANERSGIESIRTATQSIRGRSLTASNRDINITTYGSDGFEYVVQLHASPLGTNAGETNRTATGYPVALSTEDLSGGSLGTLKEVEPKVKGVGDGILSLTLDPNGRDQWQTNEGDDAADRLGGESPTTLIRGQASSTVTDPNAPIHQGMCWQYNPVTGQMNLSDESGNLVIGTCS